MISAMRILRRAACLRLSQRRARPAILLVTVLSAAVNLQAQTTPAQSASRSPAQSAMLALDRYLETWNSRDPRLWATSLHYPHVRPGAGAFEVSETAEAYAANVNFEQTLRTGWDHSEWVSREVLQVSDTKVHVAGSWQRFTANGTPQVSSAITYVVTKEREHWGIQARFAAGTGTIDAQTTARNEAAGRDAVAAFLKAWNSHDPAAVAAAIHYPHVRIADEHVETWRTPATFLAGSEPGRQRTWFNTRVASVRVVQTTSNGVNLTVVLERLGRDGKVLSVDEGLFLVVLRDGAWKVQARSMMGT